MSARRPIAPSGTLTQTITVDNQSQTSIQQPQPETLVLRLNRKKKKVSWKEGTVDNEFMGKKSSKKCCIFHKDKPFDEDFSDDECDHRPDDDKSHGHGDDDEELSNSLGANRIGGIRKAVGVAIGIAY